MMNVLEAQRLTDKDLIEAVVSQFYFLDYGFVSKVNADKTVNVVHAIKPMTTDGETLPEIVSENLEVLFVSAGALSIAFTVTPGDKVLMLGLKNPISKVSDVEQSAEQTSRLHYTRECLKVLPLCIFNEESKVRIYEEDGKLQIATESTLELNGTNKGGLVIGPELKTQLGYLTARVDALYSALENSPTGSSDGGATYKAAIVSTLQAVVNKEDFSNIENDKILQGDGQ